MAIGLYTIDPYTNVVQYNEAIQALRNNKVQFRQLISLRAPYQWYLELPYAPLLVNYDTLEKSDSRYIVTKVQPIRPADDWQLLRRESNAQDLPKYIENTPLTEARSSKYALFFNATSFDSMKIASKALPGVKIWYFGKHQGSKYKIGLCTNKLILNFLPQNSVLLEKDATSKGFKEIGGSEGTGGNAGNNYTKPGFFEADLNFRVFKGKDYLKKYSETPYFLNGEYHQVKFQGTLDNPDAQARFTF